VQFRRLQLSQDLFSDSDAGGFLTSRRLRFSLQNTDGHFHAPSIEVVHCPGTRRVLVLSPAHVLPRAFERCSAPPLAVSLTKIHRLRYASFARTGIFYSAQGQRAVGSMVGEHANVTPIFLTKTFLAIAKQPSPFGGSEWR
jgi:hypothetical protein